MLKNSHSFLLVMAFDVLTDFSLSEILVMGRSFLIHCTYLVPALLHLILIQKFVPLQENIYRRSFVLLKNLRGYTVELCMIIHPLTSLSRQIWSYMVKSKAFSDSSLCLRYYWLCFSLFRFFFVNAFIANSKWQHCSKVICVEC